MGKRLDSGEHVLDQDALDASAEARQGVEIVFPPDHRQQVPNATRYPYSTVGQLTMTFPNGGTYTGTGTLIGPYWVLTAAHNLFGNDIGGWATQVTFAPAINGGAAPWGQSYAAKINVTEEYQSLSPPNPLRNPAGNVQDYTQYVYDFGLVTLQQPFDAAGEIGMWAATDDQLNGAQVSITGYPGDKPAATMWTESGPLTGISEELLFYRIDTFGGQSGSALMKQTPAQWIGAVGVHVAGSPALQSNFAVRMNEDNIATVNGWK